MSLFIKTGFLSFGALLSFSALHCATITVTSKDNSGPNTLRQALTDANNGDTIAFNATPVDGAVEIMLETPLPTINLDLTIDGSTQPGGQVILKTPNVTPEDVRPFTILSGVVDIIQIECSELIAKGGSSQPVIDHLGGGGGGLGAGGAVFVGENATVNLTEVYLTDCYAQGGNGGDSFGFAIVPPGGSGGGGLGGAGAGSSASGGGSGGGGGGLFDDASSPLGGGSEGGDGAIASGTVPATAGVDYGGGGAGYPTLSPTTFPGANGGYGGGGGGGGGQSGTPNDTTGGDGGFGAGGGGNGVSATSRPGGMGNQAGNAGTNSSNSGSAGGGGSAFGGGIFVQKGGSLSITDGLITNHSFTNIAGLGGTGKTDSASGEDGLIAGNAIYIDEDVNISIGGGASIYSSISGKGGITIPNGEEAAFEGVNDYEGGTSVFGILDGNTDSLKGEFLVDGELNISQAADGVFVGNLMGTGTLQIFNTGTVTFNTFHEFSGTINLRDGILKLTELSPFSSSYITVDLGTQLIVENSMQIGGLNSEGTVSLSGSELTIEQEVVGSVLGPIEGAGGSIVKKGAATLRIGVENTYTGNTTVSDGLLQLNHSSAISASESLSIQSPGMLELLASSAVNNLSGDGNIELNANDLSVTNSIDTIHTGVISGTGSIVKFGAGNLSLLGANTFSGSMVFSAGTVTGNSQSFSGNIVNNASMIFDQDTDGDDSKIASLSGVGPITKSGFGSFTLDGNWTHSGTTTVSQGIFNLQGTLPDSSETIVQNLGKLQGVGTLGNLTNFGIVHPGNSIGTLHVVGNYIQNSGSTLEIEIDDQSNSSRVEVMGSATIESDTTLKISPQVGNYVDGLEYVVISTTNGVTGTFDNLTINNYLELQEFTFEIDSTTNPNEVLFRLVQSVSPTPIAAVSINPGPVLANALTIQGIWLNDSILSTQLDLENWYDPCQCERKICSFRPFIAAEYQEGDYKNKKHTLKSDFSLWGILGGGDVLLADGFLIGVAGGYLRGQIDSSSETSDVDQDSALISLYFQKQWCCHTWTLDGYLSTMWSWYDTKRHLGDTIEGETDGGSVTGKLRLTYNWDCFCNFHVQPQIGLIGNYFQICAYSEDGNIAARRKYDRGTSDFLAIEPALRIHYNWSFNSFSIVPEVKVGYDYDFFDSKTKVKTRVINDPSETGTVKIDNINENQAYLRAGLSLGIFNCFTAGAFYRGILYGDRFTSDGWSLYFKASF